jgi:hypothetical protein
MVKEWNISRQEQDELALASHRNAAQAYKDGRGSTTAGNTGFRSLGLIPKMIFTFSPSVLAEFNTHG